jgi:hypothetical protein
MPHAAERCPTWAVTSPKGAVYEHEGKANHHGKHADLAVDVLAKDLDMSPGGVRSKGRLLE